MVARNKLSLQEIIALHNEVTRDERDMPGVIFLIFTLAALLLFGALVSGGFSAPRSERSIPSELKGGIEYGPGYYSH